MTKSTYYVIETKDKKTGKFYSYALKVHHCYNLLGYFERNAGKDSEIISINACDSKKEACEVAEVWNDGARQRGLYLFDDIKF